MHIEFVKII